MTNPENSGDLPYELVSAVSDLYAKRFNIMRDPDWYILKLSEEVGELVKAYLSFTSRSRHIMDSSDGLRAVSEELVDVYAQVLLVAGYMNIDLQSGLNQKWFSQLSSETGELGEK